MSGIVSLGFSISVRMLSFVTAFGLCACLQAAESRIPHNGNFAEWEPAVAAEGWTFANNESPLQWVPVVRAGVVTSASVQRVSGSTAGDGTALALNGRILSKHVYPGYRGKAVRVSLRARGAGGHLAVYLRECNNAESRQVGFVAVAIDGPTTAEWKEYSGVVEMVPYHNDDAIQLDIDGKNIQIEMVRLDLVGSAEAEVAKAPEVICTLPKAAKVPVIDGKYVPEEWSHGVRYDNGFMDILTGHAAGLQTTCHMVSDGTTLYLSMLTDVPKNGLKTNAVAHDDDVWADDCVELHVNPGYTKGASETVYQIAINFSGIVFDVANKISIGQTERAWTCDGLVTKSGTYQGRALIEMSLPGKSIGLSSLEQAAWGLNICRSLAASKQNTSLTGGGYSDYKRMMRCQVIAEAPAVQWGFSGTPNKGQLILAAEVANVSTAPLSAFAQLTFVDGAEQQTVKDCQLAPNVSERLVLDLSAQNHDRGTFSCQIDGPDKTPFFHHSMTFAQSDFFVVATSVKDDGKQLRAEYFPFQKKCNLRVSPITTKERPAYGKAECLITSADGTKKLLSIPKLNFLENTGHATFALDLPIGKYQMQVSVFGNDGKLRHQSDSPVEVKSALPWIGNATGKDRVIIPPFTAMEYAANDVSCWGRTYSFAPTGFPRQINAVGKPLLASPIALVLEDASGMRHTPTGTLQWTQKDADRSEFTSKIAYPGLNAALAGWMEYDGCLYYKLDLIPQSGGVPIKSLALDIPIQDPSLLHAIGDNIRVNCVSTYLDEQDGVIWTSKKVRNMVVVGDFLSSIWLGRPESGLSWFAENERGWSVGLDKPHLEVIRAGKTVTLRVNFLSGPLTLTAPRHLEFGLMATPTKPRKTGAYIRPDVQAQGSFAGFFNAGLKSLDPEISRMLLKPQLSRTEALHVYHAGDSSLIGDPEFKYFLNELQREPFDRNLWEMESKKYKLKGDDSDRYISESVCWTPERIDYNIDCIKHLQEDLKVPGVYLDNSYPLFCRNIQHKNCGFIRDDGRLQAGSNFMGTREFIKRCATMSYLNQMRAPHFSVHNTDAMNIAAFAFADIAVAGEMNIPENGDHMDVFPLAHCEVLLGTHWGPTPGMLTMLGYGPRALSAKGTRSMLGLFKLYDIWNYWNSARNEAIVSLTTTIETEFGTSAADATFVGYWDARASALGLASHADVKASFFVRPGTASTAGALVYVTNLSREAKQVTLKPDFGVWKIAAPKPTDAETGKTIEMTTGLVTITVEPRDFRVLLLKPGL